MRVKVSYSGAMNRREALLSAAATLLLPTFISRAMAQSTEASQRELGQALGRARAAQRPLLVMVIPANTEEAWVRGSALGAFLNHGPEDALAALGTAELVCMRVAELARVIPNVGSAEPLLLLIDPAQTPAQVTAFQVALPVLGQAAVDPYDDREAFDRARAVEDAHFDAVIAAVAGQVMRALGSRLHGLSPAQRADALTRAREIIQHRIPGSYWMTQGGCGADIEEPPPPEPGQVVVGYDCGMGHTPTRAQRFLNFFVQRSGG